MNGPFLPSESRMTSKPAPKPASDNELNFTMRNATCDLIKINVMNALGSPEDLFRVQVRPVGKHSYRANVLVGKDATSARVVNSYYLSTDGEGTILSSTPEIMRLY